MKKMQIILLMVISLVFIAACTTLEPVQQPVNNQTTQTAASFTLMEQNSDLFDLTKTIKTEQFKTQEELSNFLKKYSGSYGYYNSYYSRDMLLADGAMVKSSGMSESAISSVAPSAVDYSGTNNQVANVDEADLLKTDGNYIYTISNNILYIVKAYPGEEAEVVASVSFNNSPQGLFIMGDKLAVFGSFWDADYFKAIDFTPRSGMSFFNVYDIGDKADPKLIKDYKFEGSYFNARMADGYIYFVTVTQPQYQRPMPYLFDGNVKTVMPIDDIYYYPIIYNNPVYATVNAINFKNPSELNSKAILVEGSQNMYMSEDNIFISYTEWINEYEIQQDETVKIVYGMLPDSDKNLISKIQNTDDDVLSAYEKKQKVWNVISTYVSFLTTEEQDNITAAVEKTVKEKLESYDALEFTVINKVHVSYGQITAEATGKVPGHIINQFSLDEENGILRVATTISQRWSSYLTDPKWTESTNNVYSLDSKMKVIGKLEGLAKNEQIYSTRFIGDRLYMVTFRQVDPFFVIDLSNPYSLKELGKLKIPGFSRYLHPYDENTIIGIGQDASDTGRTTGLKISLFDVTDVENPKEVAKYVGDDKYAYSSALYEHKAFLFSKDKDLMVIPVYNYDYQNAENNYNGAFVFKISKDEIKLRGLIDHSKATEYYYWQPSVERSLYINDMLYTKSLSMIRINRLDTLLGVKNVTLTPMTSKIPIY